MYIVSNRFRKILKEKHKKLKVWRFPTSFWFQVNGNRLKMLVNSELYFLPDPLYMNQLEIALGYAANSICTYLEMGHYRFLVSFGYITPSGEKTTLFDRCPLLLKYNNRKPPLQKKRDGDKLKKMIDAWKRIASYGGYWKDL